MSQRNSPTPSSEVRKLRHEDLVPGRTVRARRDIGRLFLIALGCNKILRGSVGQAPSATQLSTADKLRAAADEIAKAKAQP